MVSNVPHHTGKFPTTVSERRSAQVASAEAFAPQSRGLDWASAATSTWLAGGFWLDVWAHVFMPQLETFFTPWHGVLYSGFLASALVLIVVAIRGRAQGRPLSHTLPVGYGLSLIGVLIFAAGGLSDLAWHTAFGIEIDVDALLSPPHLVLALGASLIVTGPLRAAWMRPRSSASQGWAALAPALLSLGLLLSLWAGFTEYANPFSSPWPGTAPIGDWAPAVRVPDLRVVVPPLAGQLIGMAGIVIQTAFLIGGVLIVLRRWSLPFGAITLIFTIAVGLLSAAHEQFRFILVALAGGLIADLLLLWLRPTAERREALRVFAFAVPVALFALYFLTVTVTEGLSWPPSLWIGAILEAGVVGLLMSYLVTPPQDAAATDEG